MSIIIPANSAVGGGFDVDNSARFNKASADNLIRTFGTATNRRKWTLSMWTKRSSTVQAMLYSTSSASSYYQYQSGGQLELNDVPGSTYNYRLVTNAIYRDLSAWYHVVVAFDSTQGTASNRIKLYVNGEQPSLATATYPSQNFEPRVNNAEAQKFGSYDGSTDYSYDGYFSELTFIDGTQNDVTDFGEFDSDSGIWKPIDVSGLTFGNNGFHLDFKDSSALGNDAAGSNNFTANNLTAIDQSIDTCTNNFCTPNSLYPPRNGSVAFSEGNLKTVFTSYEQSPNGTIGAGAGKWYHEMKMSGTHARFGWCESHCPQGDLDSNSTFPAYAVYSNGSNGLAVYKNVTSRGISQNSGYTSFSAGDTLGIAFDIDNGKMYFSLNGTYYNSGDPANGTGALITGITAQLGGLFLPYINCGTTASRTFELNFGSPSHAISSGNADGNGYGNFEYAVPSGYYSLNTKNLAEYG